MEGRGERATPSGRASGRTGRGCQRPQSVQGGARGRAQLRGPAGQGSDIWAQASSIQPPGGSREDPSGVQLCKQEEGQGDPGDRGESAAPAAARAPALLRAVPASSAPTQKLVATNRRPRVPLAASGGVGGRARGRGRLADAAANWWADPESPRKRGRLSAVRQARLCGSGSPLLQRSPWHSRSVSAQPSRAPRAVNCSPRPLASAGPPAHPAAPPLETPENLRSRAFRRAR